MTNNVDQDSNYSKKEQKGQTQSYTLYGQLFECYFYLSMDDILTSVVLSSILFTKLVTVRLLGY